MQWKRAGGRGTVSNPWATGLKSMQAVVAGRAEGKLGLRTLQLQSSSWVMSPGLCWSAVRHSPEKSQSTAWLPLVEAHLVRTCHPLESATLGELGRAMGWRWGHRVDPLGDNALSCHRLLLSPSRKIH